MISQTLDKLRTAISGEYSDKIILANQSELEANADYQLRDGYSINVGPAINNDELTRIPYAIRRSISIVLTKGVCDSDLQSASRLAQEETLLDEIENLVSVITSTALSIQQVKFLGDSGVEMLQSDKIKFISSIMEFEFTYILN